jgi:ABC-type nitrate/sulfonate/bicarbonate transport system permease component
LQNDSQRCAIRAAKGAKACPHSTIRSIRLVAWQTRESTRGTCSRRLWRLSRSIARVLIGYLLAIAVAVPAGFLIGMSPIMSKAFDPFIQVLKPISPLAWMPLALYAPDRPSTAPSSSRATLVAWRTVLGHL